MRDFKKIIAIGMLFLFIGVGFSDRLVFKKNKVTEVIEYDEVETVFKKRKRTPAATETVTSRPTKKAKREVLSETRSNASSYQDHSDDFNDSYNDNDESVTYGRASSTSSYSPSYSSSTSSYGTPSTSSNGRDLASSSSTTSGGSHISSASGFFVGNTNQPPLAGSENTNSNSNPSNNTNNRERPQERSVSFDVHSIAIKNGELIITGKNLSTVRNIAIQGESVSTELVKVSNTSSKLVAMGLSGIKLALGKIYNVILSDAHASSAFPIEFEISDGSITPRKLAPLSAAEDGFVLKWSAIEERWIAAQDEVGGGGSGDGETILILRGNGIVGEAGTPITPGETLDVNVGTGEHQIPQFDNQKRLNFEDDNALVFINEDEDEYSFGISGSGSFELKKQKHMGAEVVLFKVENDEIIINGKKICLEGETNCQTPTENISSKITVTPPLLATGTDTVNLALDTDGTTIITKDGKLALGTMGASADGQVLKWNGTSWVAGTIAAPPVTIEDVPKVRAFADLENTAAAPQVCAAHQTLQYDSDADTLTCIDIVLNETLVGNDIQSGVTNIAPSQNAVHEALELKQDKITIEDDMEVKSLSLVLDPSNKVYIAPSPTTSGVLPFYLPADLGDDGYVLKTDGAGNLSWGSPNTEDSVTSVTASSPLVATPSGKTVELSLDVGTNAGQIPSLNSFGKLESSVETDPTVLSFAKSALPNCGVGHVLKSDGTSFSCVLDANTILLTDDQSIETFGSTIRVKAEGIMDTHLSGISSFCSNGQILVTNGLGSFYCADRYWEANANNVFSLDAIAIGGTIASSSAILDLQSTTRGFLPPRMTTSQRNAIDSPVDGLMIYDLDEESLLYFSGGQWRSPGNISFSSSPSMSLDFSPTPVFYMKFDNSMNDETSNYTANGVSTGFGKGKFGQSLFLNGTDSYVKLDDNLQDLTAGDFTASIWVRINSNSVSHSIFNFRNLSAGNDSTDRKAGIVQIRNGVWRSVYKGSSDAGQKEKQADFGPAVGEWSHVVLRKIGNTFNIFINGVLEPSLTDTISGTAHLTSNIMSLGRHHYTADSNSFLNGELDDFVMWDLALPDTKIQSIYQMGSSVSGGGTAVIANDSITLDHVDFAGPEGISVPQLSSNPATGSAGQIYYNTTSKNFMFHDGTDWKPIASGSTSSSSNMNNIEYTTKFSTASTGWVDVPGFSVSITPSSSTSKVLVMASVTAGMSGANSGYYRVLRNGTPIAVPTDIAGYTSVSSASFYGGSADGNNNETSTVNFVDTPGTTSAVTYKIQVISPQGGTLVVNGLGSDLSGQLYSVRTRSSLIVMENGFGGGAGSGPWNTSGSDINYLAGNVGIGTTTPTQKLEVAGNILSNETYYTTKTFADGWAIGDYQEIVQGFPSGGAGNSGAYKVSLSATRGNWTESATFTTVMSHADSAVWREIPVNVANSYTTYDYRCFTIDATASINTIKFRVRAINPSSMCSSTSVGNLPISIKISSEGHNAGWNALSGSGTGATVSGYRTTTGVEWNLYTGRSNNEGIHSITAKNGRVGIGTTSPTEKLHVIGHILASGNITPSDKRLKKNFEPVENALEKILALQAVTYDWKEPEKHGERRQIGVIAQEVQEAFPEAVTETNDGFLAVSYSVLVSPLIAAVKEIYGQIQDLVERLSSYEQQQVLQSNAVESNSRSIASLHEENQELKVKNQKLEDENMVIRSYLCQKDPTAPFCER